MHAPLVHIGYPKCISSWLQHHLFKADCGYLTLMDPYAVRLRLLDPAPFRYEPRLVWDFIEQKLGDAGAAARDLVPVVTSEGLSGNLFCGGYNATDAAHRLAETFPEARILIVVREQRSMIRSLYNTWLQWGMPHSVERMLKPLRPRMVPQFSLQYLCFDALVAHYQRTFGQERVLVLPFEQFLDQPREFVAQIYRLSGIEADPYLDRLPYQQRANQSTTPLNQLLQQKINAWSVRTPFNYRGWIADTPERNLARIRSGFRRSARLPRILDGYLDRRTRALIEQATEGAFRASNKGLESLTGLDLGPLGYET
jgi:hypothetical protein